MIILYIYLFASVYPLTISPDTTVKNFRKAESDAYSHLLAGSILLLPRLPNGSILQPDNKSSFIFKDIFISLSSAFHQNTIRTMTSKRNKETLITTYSNITPEELSIFSSQVYNLQYFMDRFFINPYGAPSNPPPYNPHYDTNLASYQSDHITYYKTIYTPAFLTVLSEIKQIISYIFKHINNLFKSYTTALTTYIEEEHIHYMEGIKKLYKNQRDLMLLNNPIFRSLSDFYNYFIMKNPTEQYRQVGLFFANKLYKDQFPFISMNVNVVNNNSFELLNESKQLFGTVENNMMKYLEICERIILKFRDDMGGDKGQLRYGNNDKLLFVSDTLGVFFSILKKHSELIPRMEMYTDFESRKTKEQKSIMKIVESNFRSMVGNVVKLALYVRRGGQVEKIIGDIVAKFIAGFYGSKHDGLLNSIIGGNKSSLDDMMLLLESE